MKSTETITYASIVVIAVSLFFIGTELTGFALIETGIVNVTIDTSASIVFQTALLDFGNGTITPGQVAIIDSEGYNDGSYWSGDTSGMTGLILENNGNVNVSVSLKSNKTAADFIGGTSPSFQLHVTNNETGSCSTIAAGTFNSYSEVTTSDQVACSNLGYQASEDSITIDARLTMSDDAAGAKTVGVVATATTI